MLTTLTTLEDNTPDHNPLLPILYTEVNSKPYLIKALLCIAEAMKQKAEKADNSHGRKDGNFVFLISSVLLQIRLSLHLVLLQGKCLKGGMELTREGIDVLKNQLKWKGSGGSSDMIHGSVKASKPQSMKSAIDFNSKSMRAPQLNLGVVKKETVVCQILKLFLQRLICQRLGSPKSATEIHNFWGLEATTKIHWKESQRSQKPMTSDSKCIGIRLKIWDGIIWKAECSDEQLTRKERVKPLRVRALVMTIILDLPKRILEAQIKARKPENLKSEDVRAGMLIENLKVRKAQEENVGNRVRRNLVSKQQKHEATVLVLNMKVDIAPIVSKCLDVCLKSQRPEHLKHLASGYNQRFSMEIGEYHIGLCHQTPRNNSGMDTIGVNCSRTLTNYHASMKLSPIRGTLWPESVGSLCGLGLRWSEMLGSNGPELVSPWKRVVRFGKTGKVKTCLSEPFKGVRQSGKPLYRLELPQQLRSGFIAQVLASHSKDVFLSSLWQVPLDEIHIDDKLHFVEEPVEILEREIKKLRRSRIPIIKVRWNSKRGPEFTWEREDQFRGKYPHLFTKTTPSKNVAS
ncbi:hypothetical protein Tco_0233079 [Tanacetum coccineum]